jgi:L-aminopeptidase/D-esterase-like protein
VSQASLSPGFRVGHWTDREALTGCTVVLAPPGTVGSYDIRGSSPSTRELAHLHPDTKLAEIHAVVLCGGSAYGLAASDGVMRWLEERDTGYRTPIGVVPIVASAVIFDLAAGRADIRPGPEAGRSACEGAGPDFEIGRVGAGAGATVGKWGGLDASVPGGLGWGTAEEEGLEVRALAVVNAVGDVIGENGEVIAGTSNQFASMRRPPPTAPSGTVLACVTTSAKLGKRGCRWIAARGSDGITVSVHPAHTRYDGDVVFALAAAPEDEADVEPNDLDILGHLATKAVARAVRSSVSR